MSLVTCEKCGAQVSKNADSCPRCNHDISGWRTKVLETAMRKSPCRVCGEMLMLRSHRNVSSTSYTRWVDGTSFQRTRFTITYTPCLRCGEPEPLILFGDKIIHKLLFVLPFPLGFGLFELFGISPSYLPYLMVALTGWLAFAVFRFRSVFY